MRLHVLVRHTKLYWRKKWLRAVVVLVVSTAALVSQYRLAHLPLPLDIGDSAKIRVPPIRLGQELVISNPQIKGPKGLLFSHYGVTAELTEVHIDKAIISDETQRNYRLDPRSSSTPGWVSYTARESEAGSSTLPCTTDLEALLANQKTPPTEIRFSQGAGPGNEHYRSLDAQTDVEVLLIMSTNPSPPAAGKEVDSDDDGPGCVKRLAGATLDQDFAGAFAIKSRVLNNSKLNLRFFPMKADSPIWTGKDGVFEPFKFAAPLFLGQGISIRAAGATPLEIVAASQQEPLGIERLTVGSDQLQVDLAGKGFVKVDGEAITLNVFERIQKYPLFAGILAAGNLALLTWIARLVRSLFKS